MSGDFLTDHADDPYVGAMVFPVLIFAVLCIHPVARVQPFFSARLAMAFVVLVPSTIFSLVKLNREIALASNYPSDDFYTNLHRILAVRFPLSAGLVASLAMLIVHSAIWMLNRKRVPVRNNIMAS